MASLTHPTQPALSSVTRARTRALRSINEYASDASDASETEEILEKVGPNTLGSRAYARLRADACIPTKGGRRHEHPHRRPRAPEASQFK